MVYLDIPIRHSVERIYQAAAAGGISTVNKDGLLRDEELGVIPLCIAQGWSVLDIGERMGWSHKKTQKLITQYFKTREMSVASECDRDRIAAETKIFGEMCRNKSLAHGKFKSAFDIHTSMVSALQDLGLVTRKPQEHKHEIRETWAVEIDEGGLTKIKKSLQEDLKHQEPSSGEAVIEGDFVEVDDYPTDAPKDEDEEVMEEDVADGF